METQIKENKSDNIKKLKESDFSVTKFTKDLYNQFNELYKKGDESKEIDKFK